MATGQGITDGGSMLNGSYRGMLIVKGGKSGSGSATAGSDNARQPSRTHVNTKKHCVSTFLSN